MGVAHSLWVIFSWGRSFQSWTCLRPISPWGPTTSHSRVFWDPRKESRLLLPQDYSGGLCFSHLLLYDDQPPHMGMLMCCHGYPCLLVMLSIICRHCIRQLEVLLVTSSDIRKATERDPFQGLFVLYERLACKSTFHHIMQNSLNCQWRKVV
jgi:hypothetical protein